MSIEVRRSKRGFPGLKRSTSVKAQQAAWMASRTAMQSRNEESFGMLIVWERLYSKKHRLKKVRSISTKLMKYSTMRSLVKWGVIHEVGVKC
jgi:hypothetical protein